MMIFTFSTLKDLSLIMNLTKFFAWKNIKTCLRGKIEGLTLYDPLVLVNGIRNKWV